MSKNVCTQCKSAFFRESQHPQDIVEFKHRNPEPLGLDPYELKLCPQCQRPFCERDMVNHTCMMLNYKMVIIVRKDLNMSIGKTAAQAVHAGVELSDRLFTNITLYGVYRNWDVEGARVVVLGVDNPEELDLIYRQCQDVGLNVVKYADGGITEVAPGTVTVLGIGPDLATKIDPITAGLNPL